jgi:hypothetical protein
MFKIFQFYFNPKLKKDTAFESFCFVPSAKEEEQLGDLYLIGEIKNLPLNDKRIIYQLAEVIKDAYYADPSVKTPEKALEEALLKADNFLSENLRKTKHSWLGELNFLVVNIDKELNIRISEIGGVKIFILRDSEIFEVEKEGSVNSAGFSKIVVGKLSEGDRILIANQKLYNDFWENKIFSEFKAIKNPRNLKSFIRKKKTVLKELFGVLVFVFVKKPKEVFALPRPSVPKLKLKPKLKIPFPEIRLAKPKITLTIPKILPDSPALRKAIKDGLIKALILAVILLVGYLIFH